jgi:hypothetical protein
MKIQKSFTDSRHLEAFEISTMKAVMVALFI